MPESFDLKEQRNITAELNKQLDSLKNVNEVYSTISDFASNVNDELKAVTSELGNMSPGVRDINKEINQIVTTTVKKTGNLIQNYKSLGTTLFEHIDSHEKIVELESLKNKIIDNYFGKNGAIKDLLLERVSIINDEISTLGKLVEQQTELNNQINVSADRIMGFFDSVQSGIESIPGGGFLTQLLGVDQFREKFRTGVVEGLSDTVLKIGNLSKGMVAGLGMVVVLLSLAVARFMEIDSNTREIRAQTGFIGQDLDKIVNSSVKLNREFQVYGLGLEESRNIMVALVNEYGSLSLVSDNVARSTALISKSLGLSEDAAAKVVQVFDNLAVMSGNTLDNIIATTIKLSDVADVAPQQIMNDIADSGDKLFSVMGGAVANIAQAAVEARKLGVNLDTATNIAGKLLDFESSIADTMNASVLTGQFINLDTARYLALTGDVAGMLREVRDQMGDVDEFSKLLPFQQQAFADALGLSNSELMNMMRSQEALEKLQKGSLSTFETLQQDASLSDVLNTSGVLTPLETLGAQFKTVLVELGHALLPIIKLLIPVLYIAIEFLKSIGNAINTLFAPIDMLLNIDWLSAFKRFGDGVDALINAARDVIKEFMSWFSNNAIFSTINNLINAVWDVIKEFMSWVSNNAIFSTINDLFGGSSDNITSSPITSTKNVSVESAAVVRAANRSTSITPGIANVVTDMSETNKKLGQVVDLMGKSKSINIDGRKVGDAVAHAIPSL